MQKDRKNAIKMMTATHATVRSCKRLEGVGHKLYMENFISSPDLLDNLHNVMGLSDNHKGMPRGFENITLKFKWGDTCRGGRR
jgi:hypothetical protein